MTWHEKIEDHYNQVWGEKPISCAPIKGPVHELPEDFLVLKYPPHGKRKKWTYATRCMSQPYDLHPVELHIISPYESELIVELLYFTAHYNRTGAKLGLWDSVNFGRPWLVGSTCQYGYISLPYLDGPPLENLQTEHSIVKFYWLIPVTSAEVEYKKSHGVEALEKRFEKWGLDYANPLRKSTV